MATDPDKLWKVLGEEVATTKEQVMHIGALASRLSSRKKERWVQKASELAMLATQLENIIADQRAKGRGRPTNKWKTQSSNQ
jgi:phage FluMu protein gp41